jgi:hypothetical protein
MRNRTFVTLGFLASAALAWAVMVLLTRPSSEVKAGWERVAPSEHAGLGRLEKWRREDVETVFRRRPTDASSSFVEEWILGLPGQEDADKLFEAARSAVGLPDRLDDEQPGWADFYNGLTDPFFMDDIARVCGEQVRPTEACYLGVRIVASPAEIDDDNEGEGSVVQYADIAGTEPDSAECRAYASCVANGVLGRDLPPLPEGSDEPQGTEVTWRMDAWDDNRIQVNRERINDCLATCNEALAMLSGSEANLDSVEAKKYQLGKHEARLEWCEMLLSELDGP